MLEGASLIFSTWQHTLFGSQTEVKSYQLELVKPVTCCIVFKPFEAQNLLVVSPIVFRRLQVGLSQADGRDRLSS